MGIFNKCPQLIEENTEMAEEMMASLWFISAALNLE